MLLVAGALILVTWAVIGIVLVGVGSIALRVIGPEYGPCDAFWMGLCISVAILQLWSLLFAVTWAGSALVGCVGITGVMIHFSRLTGRLRNGLQELRGAVVAALAIGLFIAVRTAGPCDYSDTGLYGAQAVRWAMTYPVVPGLANLHGRLGFNSSVFLCIAALNHGLWKGLAYHIFTGFLLLAACATMLPAWFRLVRGVALGPQDWFNCILAIPLLFWASRGVLVGTLTDEPAAIVCLIAAGMILGNGPGDHGRSPHESILAAILAALAVTFKLSTAVFALFLWCVAISLIWRLKDQAPPQKKYVAIALAFSAMIAIPWCVRGSILSGYPIYPSTLLSLPVDWKQPGGLVNWYAAGIQSYARNPNASFLAETRGWAWVWPWAQRILRNRISFQVPAFLALSGATAVGIAKWRGRNTVKGPWLRVTAASLAGMLFCLWAAPDPRFGQFAIWTTAGTLGAWGIAALGAESAGSVRTISAGLLGLFVWCMMSFGWRPPYQQLLAAKPLMRLPDAALTSRSTLSGLRVHLPTESDRCWDAPLPCTPYFDETVHLRDGQSLRDGFAANASEEYIRRVWTAPIR
jgi:hypothetical protein